MTSQQSTISTLQRGFTLIELLVVIAVIVTLASLALPALSMLRNRQAMFQARQDISMLASAVEQYLVDWGNFPDDSGYSFPRTPLLFFYQTPKAANAKVYLNPPTKRIAYWVDETTYNATADLDRAEFLLDPWGFPYEIRVTNETYKGNQATTQIRIYSTTGNNPNTAVGRLLDTHESMEWQHLTGTKAIGE